MGLRSTFAPLALLLGRMRGSSLERRDHAQEGEPVENIDTLAGGRPVHRDGFLAVGEGYPPDYVDSYDEGRPRH